MPSPSGEAKQFFFNWIDEVSLSPVEAIAPAAYSNWGSGWRGQTGKVERKQNWRWRSYSVTTGTESIKNTPGRTAIPPHPVREISQNALRERCSRTGESSIR